jgi:hypothetical protein
MRKNPDKLRTTSVSIYLTQRRKLAVGILAGKIAGGNIATLLTRLLEDKYGSELDEIEKSVIVPGSSDMSKQSSDDEKEDALFVA